jgi:hypothetical protein
MNDFHIPRQRRRIGRDPRLQLALLALAQPLGKQPVE